MRTRIDLAEIKGELNHMSTFMEWIERQDPEPLDYG
jgi:hypothetical protein